MNTLWNEPIPEDEEPEETPKGPALFDFINDINSKKQDIYTDQNSRDYQPFLVNRALSQHRDTLAVAHELNMRPHLSKSMHFRFAFTTVRRKKRYGKWAKANRSHDVEMVQRVYNFNVSKAEVALSILTEEELQNIRQRAEAISK